MSEILPLTEKANLPLAESGAGFNLKLTQGGTVLLAKALAGQQLEFKYVTLGSGVGSGNPEEATSLVNKVADLFIVNYKRLDTSVIVEAVLEYNSVPQGFTWTELGVIAIDPDTQEEVLYMYDYVQIGEVIPPAGAATQIEKQIRISTYVSNAANVTAEINESLINIPKSDIGQPNGVAPLNKDGVLDIIYGGTKAKTAQETIYNLGCMPRENLLPNWRFKINQRGKKQYTDYAYSIDGAFFSGNGTVDVHDDYVDITATTDKAILEFKLENSNQYKGKKLTFSLLAQRIAGTGLCYITSIANEYSGEAYANDDLDIISFTKTKAEDITILTYAIVVAPGNTLRIYAGKFEVGTFQTLGFKDNNGKIHILDQFDYAKELAKCQRYFRRLPAYYLLGSGVDNNAVFQYSLNPPMRIAPTIVIERENDLTNAIDDGTHIITPTKLTKMRTDKESICFYYTFEQGENRTSTFYNLRYVDVSAEL